MRRVNLEDNDFSIEVYDSKEIGSDFAECLKLFGKASTEAGDMIVDEVNDSFSKNCSVILDCSNLEYINSTVVCMILAENRKAIEKGLKIVIMNPCGLVKDVIEMLGLTNKAIDICDNLESAICCCSIINS